MEAVLTPGPVAVPQLLPCMATSFQLRSSRWNCKSSWFSLQLFCSLCFQ